MAIRVSISLRICPEPLPHHLGEGSAIRYPNFTRDSSLKEIIYDLDNPMIVTQDSHPNELATYADNAIQHYHALGTEVQSCCHSHESVDGTGLVQHNTNQELTNELI